MITSVAGVLGATLLMTQASAQGRGEGRGPAVGKRGDMVRVSGRAVRGPMHVNRGPNRAIRVRGDVVRVGVRDRRVVHGARFAHRGWNDWGWGWGGTSIGVGFGFADPYYSYGYADPYHSWGFAQPVGLRRAYYGYAAAPGCTCPPGGVYASAPGFGIGIGFGGWRRGWGGGGWGWGW
ncbi:MAG: hypothetical protein IT536_13640 [Hyphomicrobiales bacterium]|nr:hypothetical protein [Hyphomicrobiales bacterium]